MTYLKFFVLFALLLAGNFTTFAQDTSQTIQSITICDWGMMIIEHPPENTSPFITIDSPQNHSGIESNSFTLTGQGAGLFEGNVIIEITDTDGNQLLQEPTILASDDVGGEGDWSFDVDLTGIDNMTTIFVRAYSTEPRDGMVIAQDSIRLNLNSQFGLPYIDITTPAHSEATSTTPLLIEGTGGAIFENNVTIQVSDSATGEMLVETFATIQTDELAGIGDWSTTIDLPLETGTAFTIHAFSLSAEDGETIIADDFGFGVVSPFATTYERILLVQAGDPLTFTDDICSAGEQEFLNEDIIPISVTGVNGIATASTTPLVNITIDAQKPSACPMPQRLRITNTDGAYDGQLYYAMSDEPVPCTMDLRPFTQQVSLGTQPSPDYSVTINGVSLN